MSTTIITPAVGAAGRAHAFAAGVAAASPVLSLRGTDDTNDATWSIVSREATRAGVRRAADTPPVRAWFFWARVGQIFALALPAVASTALICCFTLGRLPVAAAYLALPAAACFLLPLATEKTLAFTARRRTSPPGQYI